MRTPDHRRRPHTPKVKSLEDAFRLAEQRPRSEVTLESLFAEEQRKYDDQRIGNPDLDPITQAVLDFWVAPYDPTDNEPPDSYRRGDIDSAIARAQQWHEMKTVSSVPLDDDQIIAWVKLHYKLVARDVLTLVGAGITAAQMDMRVWFGRLNKDRPRLVDRYLQGSVTVDEIHAELGKLRSWIEDRALHRAAGQS
ncbi:hypothetical protein [Williamsia muralis]|uniref:Uncharacterized protein n=1 Tax=Williamsia marianensis TaxID=85044 RepID=A0ABU4EZY7_WILMA|nr:hypothetical protein [Williamsia muralis]MDV7136824.1 hypothetical protein [Williamsia muralis]